MGGQYYNESSEELKGLDCFHKAQYCRKWCAVVNIVVNEIN